MNFETHEDFKHGLVTLIKRNDINVLTSLMGNLPYLALKQLVTDENLQGQPLIFHACQAKATRIVEFLVVECGADINMVAKIGGERLTPLLLAIKIKCTDLLLTLIKLEADLTVKDRHNRNALVFACLNDNHEAAEMLRDNKCNINSDMNVYHCADDEEYLQMALEFGTDLQYSDSDGNTILMRAALNSNAKIISLLANKNNKIYHRNNTGTNALDIANIKERKMIIPLLLNDFYSLNDYTESLEFSGAYVLLFCKSIERCKSFWNESLVQRRQYCDQINPKSNFTHRKFPLNAREFDIDTDLDIREEKDLLIDALLVLYRILSPENLVTKRAFYFVVLCRYPDVDIKTRFTLLKYLMHLNASVTHDERGLLHSWHVLVKLTSKYLRVIQNIGTTIEEISELSTEFMETLRDYVKPFLKSNAECEFVYVKKYRSLQTMGLKYLRYLVDETSTPDYRSLAVFLANSLCEEDSVTSTTVLHLAISDKMSCGVVELLTECGSDVNAVDEEGNTPLHLLIERFINDPAREKIARVLVRAGCDLNAENNSNVLLREHFPSLLD